MAYDEELAAYDEELAICIQQNSELTKRLHRLRSVLDRIAGPTECSGAMVNDENGNPFSPAIAQYMRHAHARHCIRCIARDALDSDITFGIDSERERK